MRTYHHSVHILKKLNLKHPLLYRVSLMIFFWSIFDGILAYLLPILITQHGFSKSEMGVILGSSSFAGAVFDMLASKYLKSPHFRKLYASVFLLSISFLLLLYFASTIWIFMIAMALWGIYWDIYHFANFDFVSRAVPKKENTSAFGILGIFHSLGILIAPVIAGLVIETTLGAKPFLISGIMLFLSLVVFVGLYLQSIKNREIENLPISKMRSWNFEYRIWRNIGKQLMTVLLLTFLNFHNRKIVRQI